MLARIGAPGVEALFAGIPEPLRLTAPLSLPAALPELEMTGVMARLSGRNLTADPSAQFLGGGAYRHFTPALINHMILRGEFSTSYTPYQPEVSQGTLQAIFEFQTLICMLTGMSLANASLYDGASALAEAVLMAHRIHGGDEVVISGAVHPEYLEVVRTYLRGTDLSLSVVPWSAHGQSDLKTMQDRVGSATCAVVLQSPNFFGVVEQYAEMGEFLKGRRTQLVVVVAEPTSLGVLQPPGARGADIVVGEGQGFGLPVSYGGPYVGFFATRQENLRQTPGRIVGETVDRKGRPAFTLTVKTREQDIRREKATSNICTNQGLCALAATIWLAAMGRQGLRQLAVENVKRTSYLKNRLSKLKNFRLKFEADTYNEFVLECPGPAEEMQRQLMEEQIVPGLPLGRYFPDLAHCLLICVTELNSLEQIDRLADQFKVCP